jgi:hypothetical protein
VEPVTLSEAWIGGKEERPSNIEVYIVNWSSGERPGEWLPLPADADTLRGLFERIGVGGPAGDDYHIAALRLPFECMGKYATTQTSLDELNMLASFMEDMNAFELGKFQAILTSGVFPTEGGVAALINMLYEDNFDSFNLIDAADVEALGRYCELEYDEVPEGVGYKEHGEAVQKEEVGVFTRWGYIYPRYSELSPEYTGHVPEEYRIAERALEDLRSAPARDTKEKPSVVRQIRAAKATPQTPKEQPPRQKSKGGPER